MKRKIFLFTVLILLFLLLISQVALANTDGVKVYKYNEKTNNWVEETNPVIASATGANTWSTTLIPTSVIYDGLGYIPLPATPNWLMLPKINWHLRVSQWVFLSIQYMSHTMHVDLPGDYTVDTLNFHTVTNGGVFVRFVTGGWLTDVSSPTNKIPTWAGYEINNGTIPTEGLPSNGTNSTFWYDFEYLNGFNVGNPLLVPVPGNEDTYEVWFAFRVGSNTRKGRYHTYVDIYLQSDP